MARRRWATYSLVACDLEAGEWGVAVQSKFPAVGAVVPWAAPEVGAVATQALANVSYGPRGLELLREGLTAAEAAEGDEVLGSGSAREDVAVRHLAHRDVGDERAPVRARDRDRERVRPGERVAARWMREPGGRGRGQGGREPTPGELPHPVAEHARGEAAAGDDHAGVLRRAGELRLHDRGEGEGAERAGAVPALEPPLLDLPDRPGAWLEAVEPLQPVDAGEPVPGLSAGLGVEEVVGEDSGFALLEPERADPGRDLFPRQAEASGRGLTMPTPCSRRDPAIASASPTTACETSASGSTATIGSPWSASAPSRGSNGIRASSGASTSCESASPPPEPKSSSRLPSGRVSQDMFSTTPSRRMFVFRAIWAARTATCWAALCGVVTTTASARGRS